MSSNISNIIPLSTSCPSFTEIRKDREPLPNQTIHRQASASISHPIRPFKIRKRPPAIIISNSTFKSDELRFLRSRAKFYYDQGSTFYKTALSYIDQILKVNPNDFVAADLKGRIKFS